MVRVVMETGEVITIEPYFRTRNEPILAATDVEEVYDNAVDRIKELIANYQRQGSGWRFKNVVKLDIHTTENEPIRGGTYIPLPPKLKTRKLLLT